MPRCVTLFHPFWSPPKIQSLTPPAQEFLAAVCAGTRPGLVPDETPADLGRCAQVRLALFRAALAALAAPAPSPTPVHAADLAAVLSDNAPYFSGAADLSIIIEAALDAFESDAPLAVHALSPLPAVLATLQALSSGVAAQQPGTDAPDVFSGAVRRVCDHAWPPTTVAAVLDALRALPMSQAALAAAVRRGAARARAADLPDLPAIVHQLLALAGPAARDVALAEIVRLFDRLEAGVAASGDSPRRRQLLEVEGSVLLHLEMAIKHDPDLGRAWLRRLRDGGWRPTPFSFALSLVVAGADRLEQAVVAALSSCLVKAAKDAGKRAAAPWAPDDGAAAAAAAAGIEEALLACARNAGSGQGAVVQPLVALAVSLLEAEAAAGEKAAGAGAAREQEAAAAGALGVRVLTEIFASHKECRKEVLALCSGRLAGASDAAAAPYVALLSDLVRRHPALVEAHLPEVRSALENLAALPPAAAVALLLALWPLARARRDVSDYVVVLLRKAMFSRELGARLLAARGFMFIITDELGRSAAGGDGGDGGANDGAGTSAGPAGGAGPSCAQAAAPVLSQMAAMGGGAGGATLLHELMGFLRRCLAQQPEVRATVYDGLPALLAADPAAAEAVAELLLPHVASFVEPNEAMAPLMLEACARVAADGEVKLVEPLHRLLCCVRSVLRAMPAAAPPPGDDGGEEDDDEEDEEDDEGFKSAEGEQEEGAGPALRRLFASLRRRLAATPLEDFAFDQATNFAGSDPRGALNQVATHLLLGCYEVGMEDVAGDVDARPAPGPARSEALAEEFLVLFAQHRRLTALALDGARVGAKAKRIEGLARAVGGAGAAAAAAAAKKNAACAGLGPLDACAPAMGVACLARLLDALVDDGLVPGGHAAAVKAGEQSAHVRMARDVGVQMFAVGGCLRVLQSHGAARKVQDQALAALAACGGGAASGAASDAVRALFGVPDWRVLAPSLFRAAQVTVLAIARAHAPAAAAGAAGAAAAKKDPREALMAAAVAALEQLLARSGGTLEGLAALLQQLPLPPAQVTRAASVPPPPTGEGSEALAAVTSRLPHFKQLMDELVAAGYGREIVPMSRCLAMLAAAVPPAWTSAMAAWMDDAVAAAPEALSHHPAAARALVALRLRCHEGGGRNGDVAAIRRLGADLAAGVNGEEGDDGELAPLNFAALEGNPLVSSKTLTAVMQAAAAHIDAALGPLDWALARLKPVAAEEDAAAPLEAGQEDTAVAGAVAAGAARAGWETATFQRLRGLAGAAAALARVRTAGAPAEALARSLTKLYRTLAGAAKCQLAPRGDRQLPPGRAFQDLAATVNGDLTPAVYDLKGGLQLTTTHALEDGDGGEEEGGGDGEQDDAGDASAKKAKKSRARRAAAAERQAHRDAKVLPALVYQVEEWEKHLIKVGKAGRINLMANAKRAVNWDFKIDDRAGKRARAATAAAAEPEEDQVQEEAEEDEEEAMDEEGDAEEEEEEEEGAGASGKTGVAVGAFVEQVDPNASVYEFADDD